MNLDLDWLILAIGLLIYALILISGFSRTAMTCILCGRPMKKVECPKYPNAHCYECKLCKRFRIYANMEDLF